MHQGKVEHNYEDDAVDVVSSSDDPLTEIDIETCTVAFLFHLAWEIFNEACQAILHTLFLSC